MKDNDKQEYDQFAHAETTRKTRCTWSQRGEAYRSACGYYHTLDEYRRRAGVCLDCGRKIRLIKHPTSKIPGRKSKLTAI